MLKYILILFLALQMWFGCSSVYGQDEILYIDNVFLEDRMRRDRYFEMKVPFRVKVKKKRYRIKWRPSHRNPRVTENYHHIYYFKLPNSKIIPKLDYYDDYSFTDFERIIEIFADSNTVIQKDTANQCMTLYNAWVYWDEKVIVKQFNEHGGRKYFLFLSVSLKDYDKCTDIQRRRIDQLFNAFIKSELGLHRHIYC